MASLQRVPVVYLAGGMRSNWQDLVKRAFKEAPALPVIFIDPREHGCKEEALYTAWDLEGVRRSDILFGYLEKDNPSGAGLALEIGFAAALNEAPGASQKEILFVEDPQFPYTRYFGMARVCSDRTFRTLEDGIAALRESLQVWHRKARGSGILPAHACAG